MASEVIWDPEGKRRSTPALARGSESAARARRRGLLRAVVACAVGAAIFVLWSPRFGGAVLAFGAVVGGSALISPTGLYAGLEKLFAWTGRLAGQAMAWIVLVPTFYVVFLSFGAFFRRGRRDRLRRFFETDTPSYWKVHPDRPASDLARQF